MKKSTYEVSYGANDVFKYDILFKQVEINNTKIDMSYSPTDGQWTNPGKKIVSLYDNGDFISIKVGSNKEQVKSIYLDHMEVKQLRLILHAYDEANKMRRPDCYPARLNKFTEYK